MYSLTKNIYDKNGVLLLSKGQAVSEHTLDKLRRMDCLELDGSLIDQIFDRHQQTIEDCSETLRGKFDKVNTITFSESSQMLESIIFESKSKPWWLLVNTLSNYVNWIYTHSINVSILSVLIGKTLHYDAALLQKIALGSLLHDVGKMMIPKSVIQKSEGLGPEEFVIIRQHCDLGMSLVKDFNLDKVCTDIIMQHHERMDGSGYPFGLTDSEIPQYSKIVMVADILDAATSYRPYKASNELSVAFEELKSEPEKYPQDIVAIVEAYCESCSDRRV